MSVYNLGLIAPDNSGAHAAFDIGLLDVFRIEMVLCSLVKFWKALVDNRVTVCGLACNGPPSVSYGCVFPSESRTTGLLICFKTCLRNFVR